MDTAPKDKWNAILEEITKIESDWNKIYKGLCPFRRRFYERNMFFQCLTPPYPLIKEQYCENLLMDFEKILIFQIIKWFNGYYLC